jgi:hypothetical protein
MRQERHSPCPGLRALHQQREARERLAAGETQRSVARSYNVSQSTISRASMNRRIKPCPTTAIALCGLLTASPATADWQYTKWGMNIDQASRASGNTLRSPNPQEKSGGTINGLPPGLVGNYDNGSFHFSVALCFGGPGQTLSRVYLMLKDYAQWPSLVAALRSLYGEPSEHNRYTNGETMRWRDENGRNEIQVKSFTTISTVDLIYSPLPSAKGL